MSYPIQRRQFLQLTGLAAVLASGLVPLRHLWAADAVEKVEKTNSEWRKILTAEQYDILRNEGTEHPFSSPLLNEHREGGFSCVACDLPLFTSDKKFDSGTGWPSFFEAITGHIETKTDTSLFMTALNIIARVVAGITAIYSMMARRQLAYVIATMVSP